MIRNPKHLAFIRALSCCKCGAGHNIQAAHIRKGTDGGTAVKPSDCYTVPLCHECHAEQHRVGEVTFFKNIDRAREFALSLYMNTGNYNAALLRIVRFKNALHR